VDLASDERHADRVERPHAGVLDGHRAGLEHGPAADAVSDGAPAAAEACVLGCRSVALHGPRAYSTRATSAETRSRRSVSGALQVDPSRVGHFPDPECEPVLPFRFMLPSRVSHPHLRLTAAILVAVIAALAGGFAMDTSEARARRAELHSSLRLAVLADDADVALHANGGHALERLGEAHEARAALIASDTSGARAERSIRRLAAHARAAVLRTTALPPPKA
jgi:hypothetical protein